MPKCWIAMQDLSARERRWHSKNGSKNTEKDGMYIGNHQTVIYLHVRLAWFLTCIVASSLVCAHAAMFCMAQVQKKCLNINNYARKRVSIVYIVKASYLLQLFIKGVSTNLVKIVTTKMCVPRGRKHLKDTISNLKNCKICDLINYCERKKLYARGYLQSLIMIYSEITEICNTSTTWIVAWLA